MTNKLLLICNVILKVPDDILDIVVAGKLHHSLVPKVIQINQKHTYLFPEWGTRVSRNEDPVSRKQGLLQNVVTTKKQCPPFAKPGLPTQKQEGPTAPKMHWVLLIWSDHIANMNQ